MLTVRNIQVRGLHTDYNHVSWEIENTGEELTNYTFTVLRSEAEGGEYLPASDPLVDTFLWRDNSFVDVARLRQVWYQIKVTNTQTSQEVIFGARDPKEVLEGGLSPGGVGRSPDPPIIAQEIIYRQRLYYEEYAGRSVVILPIRTWGQRCISCWDKVKKQRRGDCQVCWGSAYVGGFYQPVLVTAQVVEQTQASIPGDMRLEPGEVLLTMGSFPQLKSRDILVELMNDRWRVSRTHPSFVQRALVSQKVVLTRLAKRSIEYQYPIEGLDPIRFDATDEREHIKPQNLDAYHEYKNRYDPRGGP